MTHLSRLKIRLLLMILLIVLLSGVPQLMSAQDDPDIDTEALAARILLAAEQPIPESYEQLLINDLSLDIVVYGDDNTQQSSQLIEVSSEGVYAVTDEYTNPNVLYNGTVSLIEQSEGADDFSFTALGLDVEGRFVDDVAYGLIEVVDSTGESIDLPPEGWFVLQDASQLNFSGGSNSGLAALLQMSAGVTPMDSGNVMRFAEMLPMADIVTVDAQTFDDGIAVDVISQTFSGQNLVDNAATLEFEFAFGNPAQLIRFAEVFSLTLVYALDESNTIRGSAAIISATLQRVPTQIPGADGQTTTGTLDMVYFASVSNRLQNFDIDLERVEAPTVEAE